MADRAWYPVDLHSVYHSHQWPSVAMQCLSTLPTASGHTHVSLASRYIVHLCPVLGGASADRICAVAFPVQSQCIFACPGSCTRCLAPHAKTGNWLGKTSWLSFFLRCPLSDVRVAGTGPLVRLRVILGRRSPARMQQILIYSPRILKFISGKPSKTHQSATEAEKYLLRSFSETSGNPWVSESP